MSQQILNSQIRIRPATEADVAFIFNSWLRCFRYSSFASMSNPIYFTAQHKLIEHLLKRCQVLVACDDKDISHIFSYGVAEQIDNQLVVHFVYTKDKYRKLGIGLTVLEALGHKEGSTYFYTHKTHQAERLEKKHGLVYHPYLAFCPDVVK